AFSALRRPRGISSPSARRRHSPQFPGRLKDQGERGAVSRLGRDDRDRRRTAPLQHLARHFLAYPDGTGADRRARGGEQRHYVDTMRSNGNALLRLINEILDVAKIESGRLSFESASFDLED